MNKAYIVKGLEGLNRLQLNMTIINVGNKTKLIFKYNFQNFEFKLLNNVTKYRY